MQLEAEGNHIPELDDEPILNEDEFFYLQAFNRLTNSRQVGFGVGGIPYSEISKYGDDIGFYSVEDKFDFIDIITIIDGFFIDLVNKDNKGGE